jgi:hypothetical protein
MRLLISNQKVSDQCRKLLYALVFIMVFEGLLRKLMHPLNMVIFFLKDIICVVSILVMRRASLPSTVTKLKNIWFLMFFLFLPLLYFTGFKDPILAFFALKQYLLYIVLGALVVMSFPLGEAELFRRFLFFAALLLIPTTIIALVQNALPASHWLNASVGGESMEAFSAAGFLRVSSTFSFTAQYSWFLNAEAFLLAASFFMPPALDSGLGKIIKPFIYIVLLLMLAVSAFVTGGRTAVVGSTAVFSVGFALLGTKRPRWILSKGLLVLAFLLVGLAGLRAVKPQYFMAYDERSAGDAKTTHNQEIAGRVASGFTDWTIWFWDQDAVPVILGNGLGIMSNGANQVSRYAAFIRDTGAWTEGDVPTTFWEGGLYLALVWYGFRLFLIWFCFRMWQTIKDDTLSSAAAVPLAYVIIHGFTAQLGMQPPLSIWFWLAIGIVLFLHSLYSYQLLVQNSKRLSS